MVVTASTEGGTAPSQRLPDEFQDVLTQVTSGQETQKALTETVECIRLTQRGVNAPTTNVNR